MSNGGFWQRCGNGLLSQAALPQRCPHPRLPGTQATFIPDMKEARGTGGTSFKLQQVLAKSQHGGGFFAQMSDNSGTAHVATHTRPSVRPGHHFLLPSECPSLLSHPICFASSLLGHPALKPLPFLRNVGSREGGLRGQAPAPGSWARGPGQEVGRHVSPLSIRFHQAPFWVPLLVLGF